MSLSQNDTIRQTPGGVLALIRGAFECRMWNQLLAVYLMLCGVCGDPEVA